MGGHRKEVRIAREERQQRLARLGQAHLEGHRVDRPHAERVDRHPPLDDVARIDDDIAEARIGRGGLRIERAAEAGDEVAGRHRRAVRPFAVGAQLEGEDEAVVRHRPAFGRARDLVATGVQLQQAVEQVADDPALVGGEPFGRIERVGLGEIAAAQFGGGGERRERRQDKGREGGQPEAFHFSILKKRVGCWRIGFSSSPFTQSCTSVRLEP